MTSIRVGKKIPPGFSMDVEFEIGSGVTALYGPRSSGKTLVLEMLAGFVRPDSGRILRDDVLLYDAAAGVHVPARRRGCGYIPEGDALFPHLTLRQNLMFGARAHPRLERHRRVAEILERFDLAGAAMERSDGLAPAQRFPAAIARALLASPKLLLLDSPDISEPLFRKLRNEFSGPILFASRDLDLCAAVSDQIFMLDAGRILQRGKPQEVLDHPESVEVARLLGIPNCFEATIAALDPGRNNSRLQLETAAGPFDLTGPYVPGHFRGDRIWIAIHPERIRVHASAPAGLVNARPAQLLRVSPRARGTRLEFSGGLYADLSADEYTRQKDNREWQVEIPPEALRIL